MEKINDLTFMQTVTLVNTFELCFTVSTSINHECTRYRDLTVVEYAFIRNLINFCFSAVTLAYYRIHPFEGFITEKKWTFVMRTVIGNLTYLGFTAVYRLLPLGIGATIIATNPFLIAIL